MVIKDTDAIDSKIDVLNGLLDENLSATQRKQVQFEISMLKKGFQGEKQAAYYIDQYFPNRFIAHDLRIEMDGFVAQIDHIAINKFGFVVLFETKNFSSDIKIDDDGVFHYYEVKRKSFRPFPSPIEQSKRHAKVLEKVFEEIGFSPISIEHIVVFDHKSKVTKPNKGYENVCYPDMIERTFDKMVDKVDLTRDFGAFGRLIKKAVKKDKLKPEQALRKIVEQYHSPILVDYRAKFSIQLPENKEVKKVAEKVSEPAPDYKTPQAAQSYDMLTIPKAAEQVGLKSKQLENILIEKGLLEFNEINFLMLTNKGKQFGIRFRKGRGGIYYLIPAAKIEEFR